MNNLKRIEREFEDFRNEILSLSKEKIFDEAYKIRFYREVSEWIVGGEYEIKNTTTLAGLYDFYLSNEYLSITTWSDIGVMISEYEYEN